MKSGKTLTTLLGIEVPIIQAPMILQASLVPLAAAVSNAGGMGSLGCAEMSVTELKQSVSKLRLETQKPFNLNFFLHDEPKYDPYLDTEIRELIKPLYEQHGLPVPCDASSTDLETFNDEKLAVLVEERPAMVSFHFGCPTPHVLNALHSVGVVTAATATTVQEAVALQKSGVMVIVAQGWEAGGHRGSFQTNFEDNGTGTLALVPQIVDAVSVPVIAAGGIGDGRAIAASRALGASGVWMGTAFLSCFEVPITPLHRKALLSADDEDTHLSRAFSGRPCRARQTPYSQHMSRACSSFQDFPLMYNYSGPLKRFGIDTDRLDCQFLLYGQAAALNREMTAAQLIETLTSETTSVVAQLDAWDRKV